MNGLQYMYGNATIYQLVYTAIGIVGLLVTVHLLVQSMEDLHALKSYSTYKPGGMRHIIARNNVRNMGMRAAKLLVLVVISLASMLAPITVTHPTVRALLTAIGFGSIEIIIVVGAIADRRDRAALFFQIRTRRVDKLLVQLEEAKRGEGHVASDASVDH